MKLYAGNSSIYRVKRLTFFEYAQRTWRTVKAAICMSFKRRSTNCFTSHNRNSKSWSIILTKEHRLKILENKVFRKVSGNDDREVIGGCRNMHYEQLR